jgi:MSHA pilin protein MshC
MPDNTDMWYCKLSIVNHKGFTLIEIVTTLVIIGVLSVIAAVRFTGTSTISARGAADMIQADIRYAQEAAMAKHTAKSVNFSTGSSAYTFSPASGMDPLGELPLGITISNDFIVTFNTLGEPTAGGGGSVSISADGQIKTVSVANYTGKVSIE